MTLNFAEFSSPDLWKTALGYLVHCPTVGVMEDDAGIFDKGAMSSLEIAEHDQNHFAAIFGILSGDESIILENSSS